MVEGPTRHIAQMVSSVSNGDLPDGAVDLVKRIVLDTVGVTVLGAAFPGPRVLYELTAEYGSTPTATVIGMPGGADPATAALVNGTSAHALDYDDYAPDFSGHPSVALVPALLALAERYDRSGMDVIRSYAVGYEYAILVSRAVNPEHYDHGWHGTGTIGTMAATFAAVNLLELDEQQAINAIAIAASSAAGLRGNFGTDVKPYHAGNAARSAVMSAELGKRGYIGDPEILEGRYGFFATFSPKDPHIRSLDIASPGTWRLLDPGITTKLYPSCGSTHPGIAGMLRLRQQYGLTPANVEHIDIGVTDVSMGSLQYPRPRTGLEGKFSMQYTVARALLDGAVGVRDFGDDAVLQPEIVKLVTRIDMRPDDDLNRNYVWGTNRTVKFRIETTSGDVIEHHEDTAPGTMKNFSHEAMLEKFVDCVASGAPVAGTADEIRAAVDGLDTASDIRHLTGLLQGT